MLLGGALAARSHYCLCPNYAGLLVVLPMVWVALYIRMRHAHKVRCHVQHDTLERPSLSVLLIPASHLLRMLVNLLHGGLAFL